MRRKRYERWMTCGVGVVAVIVGVVGVWTKQIIIRFDLIGGAATFSTLLGRNNQIRAVSAVADPS